MIDGHIHINNQPYCLELIDNMIKIAQEKGIDELYILDHTHKFFEFNFLYESLVNKYGKAFIEKKKKNQVSLKEYIEFIKLVKSKKWPICIKFGLEVCYFKEKEDELKKYLSSLEPFKFDFLIGSIHFTDGYPVDITKDIYLEVNVDEFYKHYFDNLINVIHSQMFDILAHPDLIKLFNVYPSYSLLPYYEKLAIEAEKYNQRLENNTGLLRYGYPYGGMDKELIKILLKHNVKFHKSSDAHKYEDIGRSFFTIIDNL